MCSWVQVAPAATARRTVASTIVQMPVSRGNESPRRRTRSPCGAREPESTTAAPYERVKPSNWSRLVLSVAGWYHPAQAGPSRLTSRENTEYRGGRLLAERYGGTVETQDPEKTITPDSDESSSLHEHGHWGAHDHAEGLYGHIHDPEHDDFFHTHPGEPEMITLTPEEAGNRITLTSVGIDVGSSTSHLMFSQLVLERQGLALSSRFKVVERRITHRSPILLTPYIDPTTIDTEELSRFIEGVYKDAGMTVDDVQTGATIVTGEAAKKENAAAISALFAEHAGKFVCATAGPNLEAVMAAHGSGAGARSLAPDGTPRTVLNIDMGGGTTKFAVCRGGEILETAAINVGARLVAMDEHDRLIRIEPAVALIAEALGIPLMIGEELSEEHQRAMADLLAECLYNVAERRPLESLTDRLMITGPLTYTGPIDSVSFSGGVS